MKDMIRRNRFALAVLFILVCSMPALAGDVTLAWDAVTAAGLAGYKVHYGTASRTYGTPLLAGNQTTYTVSSSYLPSGHTYYFAVTAYDTSGNESGYSNEVSKTILASPDTTPPTISSVASSSVTSTGATITWTTNEASDTQVEYGATTSYGSSTTLDASLTMLHSQALTGLSAGTLYHYRVKSKDSDGNLATSGDYTVTTKSADTAPHVISSVLAGNLTSTSAVISWTTDKPADTKVEYGKTVEYTKAASLGDLKTDHSIRLRRLNPSTQYHFRALSTGEDGSQAISNDFTFTTLALGEIEKTLIIPRSFAGQPDRASATSTHEAQASTDTYEFLGFALINMDGEPATLVFTAMDSMGNVIAGPDIANPVLDELGPEEQMGVVDFEIFGEGLCKSTATGYIKVEGTSTKITGLYTIFDSDLDSNLTVLDGTNLAAEPMTTFVFPEIEGGNHTKVNISNSNVDSVSLTFELVGADGVVRTSVQNAIAGNGAIVADLFDEIFSGVTPDPTEYVRVRASQGVQAFELLHKSTSDISALIGQDANGGATRLYSPQFAMGDIYRSSVSIVNLDSVGGLFTMKFISEDASQIGVTKIIYLPPNGKVHIDDPDFFQELDLDVLTQGYLEITSFGMRLAGSVMFGESSGKTFSTALPLVSKLQYSMLFSHVASNDIYYTGYAVVNPNSADATAKFELFAADGSLMGTKFVEIPAGHRTTKLFTEYFPELKDQDIRSGYMRISVNEPVAAYSIYGTSNLSVISAIPTQEIP
jgi:hypothetical protein